MADETVVVDNGAAYTTNVATTQAEAYAAAAKASAEESATSATESANSASAAATSETNAASSETNAANSANAAANSATAAATSESNASASATNAATSESNALTYVNEAKSWAVGDISERTEGSSKYWAEQAKTTETTVAGYVSAAETSATNAATSETNAANSATAAKEAEDSASAYSHTATSQATLATSMANTAATEATNAETYANTAKSWAIGDITERTEGSAKYWAEQAESYMGVASETSWGITRFSTEEEADAGTNDNTSMTPLKVANVIADNIGKGIVNGFDGTLSGSELLFAPTDTYNTTFKENYDYEIDLNFSAAGTIDDDVSIRLVDSDLNSITIRNALSGDSAATFGQLRQVMRYDDEVGFRWRFNARYKLDSSGNKVLLISSTVINLAQEIDDSTTKAPSSNAVKTLTDSIASEAKIAEQLAQGIYRGTNLEEKFAAEIANYSSVAAWLHARCAAGDFTGIYPFDYFYDTTVAQTVDGTTIAAGQSRKCVIAAVDPYYNATSSAMSHHLIIFAGFSAANVQYNTTNNNNGSSYNANPWKASKLYAVLNGVNNSTTNKIGAVGFDGTGGCYKNTFSTALRNIMVEQYSLLPQRYSSTAALTDHTTCNWNWEGRGIIFAPSEREVQGCAVHAAKPVSSQNDFEGYGPHCQWDIFKTVAGRLLYGRANWWCSSVTSGGSTDACSVAGGGEAACYATSAAYVRAPLCFFIA